MYINYSLLIVKICFWKAYFTVFFFASLYIQLYEFWLFQFLVLVKALVIWPYIYIYTFEYVNLIGLDHTESITKVFGMALLAAKFKIKQKKVKTE